MPSYVDAPRLCEELRITPDIIDTLIARHVLPRPLLLGGEELRWKWETVNELLSGRVYFLDGGDLIKIGFSKNIKQRLKEIRTYSPIKLKVLCMIRGGKLREATIHAMFAHLRAHGEWFRATPELLAYISTLKARPLEPVE
jgi:predicted DNA-binding transcriptional regulator AlpA